MKKILIGMLVLSLTACSRSEKVVNPSVSDIGVIEGCTVKYVDRGSSIDSFFMARCQNTTTVTNVYKQSQGKSTVLRRQTAIIQEIEKLEREKDLLEEDLGREKAMLGKTVAEPTTGD